MKKIIDLTHSFTHNMPVYPGDDAVSLEQIRFHERDHFADFQVKTSMHVGTHIDGPRHLLKGAPFIADIPINNFVGRGVLLDARGKMVITRDLLHGKNIEKNAIVLVLTGWDKKYNDPAYMTELPVFDKDFVQALIESNIRLVGVDMPSVDDGSLYIHKIFFEHTIMIIENLTHLDALVDVAEFTVYALPLKIEADSSLARVIAVCE